MAMKWADGKMDSTARTRSMRIVVHHLIYHEPYQWFASVYGGVLCVDQMELKAITLYEAKAEAEVEIRALLTKLLAEVS